MRKTKKSIAIIVGTFKLLYKSAPFYIVAMCIANIFAGVLLSLGIVIWKNIIDSVQESIKSGHLDVTILWLAVHFTTIILQDLLTEVCAYYKNILSTCTNKNITQNVLNKISKMELEKYDDVSFYDKLKKVNEESTARTMSLLNSVEMLVKGISVAVSTAVILFRFNPLFMILCIIISIPNLIINMKIAIMQYSVYCERFENKRYIDSIKNLITAHENVKEIKIYNSTPYFVSYILNSYKKYIEEDKKIRKKFVLESFSMESLGNILIYFLKAIVCYEIVMQKMSIGSLTLYFSSIDNFRSAMANIINVMSSMFEDGLYVQSYFELMKDTETTKESGRRKKFISEFHNIRFENVWFSYPGTQDYVLKDINFVINRGKNYAIVGLNGSGKTTLLKLLLRLYKPTKGTIYIDEIDINEIDIDSYYKEISVVFQDFIKYPLTIKDNIGLGNISEMNNLEKINEAAAQGGILEFVNSLPMGMETHLQKEWSNSVELSLGQWQKVAISRAFFKNGQIMILDEPTASLDPMAERDLFQKVKDLTYEKTCVLIAHRFSTVRLADVIYVMKNGEIIESGSHNQLINKNGEYALLFSVQAKGYFEDYEL